MFDTLSDRFKGIIKKIKGESRLTEENMDAILKEMRLSLLEADVNFKVVKKFISDIKERCNGENVYLELKPSEMVLKIVKEELTKTLGEGKTDLYFKNNDLTVITLLGLQGSGKTTSAGKLAYLLKNKLKKKVMVAACDTYRLGAYDQLNEIAKKVGVPCFHLENKSPIEIAKEAKKEAKLGLYDVLIIDTAGRLTIDETMMEEISKLNEEVEPDEKLLIIDSLNGQEALNTTNSFNEKVGLTGVIMTKLDSDTRGGAALSIRYETGLGIKFSGVGEKLEDLDIFYPERMASRILGMGDVLTFVEKVQDKIDEKEMVKTTNKMMSNDFTLDDLVHQMKQIQKLGSMRSLLKFIPGMPKISEEDEAKLEKEMKNFESIINSMTLEERRNPHIIKNSRKVRIAKGCGKTNQDVNRVLKKYDEMKEMMKKMKNNKFPFMKF